MTAESLLIKLFFISNGLSSLKLLCTFKLGRFRLSKVDFRILALQSFFHSKLEFPTKGQFQGQRVQKFPVYASE